MGLAFSCTSPPKLAVDVARPAKRGAGSAKKSSFWGVSPCDYRYMLLAARIDDVPRLNKSLWAQNPLECRDDHNNSPLHIAAARGHCASCATLLRTEPNLINSPNSHRSMPLHLAAAAGELCVVDILLGSGAEVDARGPDGRSALHLACRGGHAAVISRLLDAGADADLRAASGDSCRELCANAPGRPAEEVETLLSLLPQGALAVTKREYERRLHELLETQTHHDEASAVDRLELSFLCPITMRPLVDPVRTSDGHVYERYAILQWLEQHDTSPLTGARLEGKELTPDEDLRRATEQQLKHLDLIEPCHA